MAIAAATLTQAATSTTLFQPRDFHSLLPVQNEGGNVTERDASALSTTALRFDANEPGGCVGR